MDSTCSHFGSFYLFNYSIMIYKQHAFYLCKTPLSASGVSDVEVLNQEVDTKDFPDLFKEFESKRSHAFNQDQLYSIVRADDVFDLIRATSEDEAKELAWEKAQPDIVTNLQHRSMQDGDKNAAAILKDVHGIED
jgi:hypothetical protein